jgi:hypothetical protein
MKKIPVTLIVSVLTNKLFQNMVLYGLQKLSKRTDNKIDDEIVRVIAKLMSPELMNMRYAEDVEVPELKRKLHQKRF